MRRIALLLVLMFSTGVMFAQSETKAQDSTQKTEDVITQPEF